MSSSNARVARTLPTITANADITSFLKVWGMSLRRTLRRPRVLKAPWNFKATNKRGGILLEWASVKESDGYEILRSDTADFSSAIFSTKLRGGTQNSFFDALSAAPQAKYYKIRATSGTDEEPQSVAGILSGIVSSTSIDSTDLVTPPTTTADQFTSDQSQGRGKFAEIV